MQGHPTRLAADGVFFFVPCGDRLAVKDAGATSPKRQFEPGSPHQIGGTVIVGAMAAPSHQPWDCGPWYPIVANITATALIFHCTAQSLNMTDCGRHEYPSQT
jgi:hypothetical protein